MAMKSADGSALKCLFVAFYVPYQHVKKNVDEVKKKEKKKEDRMR
jgi:hypothetical protein